MDNCVQMVAEFHEKYGFPRGNLLVADKNLSALADQLIKNAAEMSQDTDAAVRAHLIVEEVSELMTALTDGDEVTLLDALVDLLYVTVGTAVTYGLPLAEGFNEVHRSNMTKSVEQSRPGHPGKGDGYSPPNLSSLLRGRLYDEQL